jgi:hypothetical protein
MHRRTRFLMSCFVITLLAALSAPRASAQTGTVTCESRGSDREQCAIERGASVELSRQMSDTPCRRNANWGIAQEYIWVSGGCRAQFAVTAGSPAGPASVRLVRQISQNPCRLNDTYGMGQDYLWVAKGCRGEFEVR